jgi:single-strand DNA-binding protein
MATINQLTIVGYVGQDPEIRYMPNGDAVANLSVATSYQWKDKQTGDKKEETEWHRCNLFKQQAEFVDKYVKKGDLVYVLGRVRTRKWQNKDGQDQYSREVVASDVRILHSKDGKPQDETVVDQKVIERASAATPSAAVRTPAGKFDDMEDDIPF